PPAPAAPTPFPSTTLFRSRGRRFRHDDGRRDAETPGVVRHCLRMISGGRRDHAARALIGRKLKQFVERAALLVGRGELEVLELQDRKSTRLNSSHQIISYA